MRRRGFEIVVKLFDVLAVIAFRARESEEAFFEDGVFAIPKC